MGQNSVSYYPGVKDMPPYEGVPVYLGSGDSPGKSHFERGEGVGIEGGLGVSSTP